MSTVLQRHSRGVLMQVKGDCPGPIHSDQIVLRTVRREAGPDLRWPKALKNQDSQRGYQAPVHSDQTVLVMAWWEAVPHEG